VLKTPFAGLSLFGYASIGSLRAHESVRLRERCGENEERGNDSAAGHGLPRSPGYGLGVSVVRSRFAVRSPSLAPTNPLSTSLRASITCMPTLPTYGINRGPERLTVVLISVSLLIFHLVLSSRLSQFSQSLRSVLDDNDEDSLSGAGGGEEGQGSLYAVITLLGISRVSPFSLTRDE
jgi:hypothetical protein